DLFNRYDNLYITKYDKDIVLENIYANYKIRPELSKSKKFYENAFNTAVDYDALMDFKKELM
ncbi:MAG TPA: ATP-binding protein, partial [Mollicutes bacterium]|nr:ATP-binding protein [Mollicutes bacterium]